MKLRSFYAAGIAMLAAGAVAWAAGNWSTLPIVGQFSFCASNVSGVASPSNAPYLQVPGSTQGTGSGICGQTIPAGPPFLTGAELIPADTGLANSAPPQTVTIPSGTLTNRVNWLVGSDFGQNLWQRGTTPLSSVLILTNLSQMGADGWYAYSTNNTITMSKQTGTADQPPGSLASARVQRASGSSTAQICTGQLVPDDSSQGFVVGGRTAIFSVDMLAGANFSAANSAVTMVIAYHSASDAAASTSGYGTNTRTFASSVGTTQNITNYTEAVATSTPITTAWARYSVAAAIPALIPGTATATQGIGVKLCFTPAGTAGTNDWFEFGKAQLEYRSGLGTSNGASPYTPNLLSVEWAYEQARYFQISESATATVTPVYALGMIGATNNEAIAVLFPTTMRIAPSMTPIVNGGFKYNIAGTQTSVGTLTPRVQTQNIGNFTDTVAATAGQATMLQGSGAGTGIIGFSAEP